MNIICLDTETTGIDRLHDEILQLSIINGDGQVLFNEYFKPVSKTSWDKAESINGISPSDVMNCRSLLSYRKQIEKILSTADVIVGYNVHNFDLELLFNGGIRSCIKKDSVIVDIMHSFSAIYGEWSNYHGSYKYQKLITCAEYYGYSGSRWHDSLDDAKATLFCFYAIYGNPPQLPPSDFGIYREYVWKPPFSFSSAPVAPLRKNGKPWTRIRCYVYAFLWFFFSGGVLFPVSIHYILKACKVPRRIKTKNV